MPTVRVKENEPFEVAMRRFKRTVEKTGLLTELRAREYYEKPTDERKELTDSDVVSVIEKMIKQRRESIAQFEKAARNDLADAEKFELEVLSAYLPQQMSDAEIRQEVEKAIAE